jgi:hypothetical protein
MRRRNAQQLDKMGKFDNRLSAIVFMDSLTRQIVAGFTTAETSNRGHFPTGRWTRLPEGAPNTPASSARGLGLKFAVIFG